MNECSDNKIDQRIDKGSAVVNEKGNNFIKTSVKEIEDIKDLRKIIHTSPSSNIA